MKLLDRLRSIIRRESASATAAPAMKYIDQTLEGPSSVSPADGTEPVHPVRAINAFCCRFYNRIVDSASLLHEELSATHLQTGQRTHCKCVAERTWDALPRSEELPGRTVDLPIDPNPYEPAPKRGLMEIKLDAARHPRRRRHHKCAKKKLKNNAQRSHLESVLDTLESMPCTTSSSYLGQRHPGMKTFDAGLTLAKSGVMIAAAVAADSYDAIRHKINEKSELAAYEAALAKRRKYYPSEVAKRRAIAAELRSVVPPPENPRPAPEQLLEAYRHRHEDEAAKLYFGRLMIDLEENERLNLEITGNKITRVSGGVRDWLETYCPELAHHYHTCMRFKRMVQDDPTPPESTI